MPTAIVKLNEEANQVINIVKAKYGLRDKSEAINKMAEEYEKQLLEPELRPEYVDKLRKIGKEKSLKVKDVDAYFEKLKKSWFSVAYTLKRKEHLDRVFAKIAKKGPVQFQAIQKKVKQILEDPHRFKPLSASMKNKRRVHIYKSFVLVYEIQEKKKIVELWDYDHHDKIYSK